MTGVYKIRRQDTDECYVGSSVNIEGRWRYHRSSLRRGISECLHLQAVWNKYGENAFVFELLEEAPKDELLSREQHYINSLHPAYNIARSTTAPFAGRTHTPDVIARASARMIGSGNIMFGKKHTPETIAKICDKRAKQVFSEETRQLWSKQRRGVPKSAAFREKIRGNKNGCGNRGIRKSAEAKANMSAAMKLRWADPVERAKMTQSLIGRTWKTGSK